MEKHEKEREKVKAVFVGPDAENTPWNFHSCSNNPMPPSDPETVQPQPPMLPRPREIGEFAPASASALLPASVRPPALSTGSSSVQGSSKDVGTSKAIKRKRDDGSNNENRASSSLSTLGMLLVTPQANPPLAPEASSIPEILPTTTIQGPGLRRSSRTKKPKLDDAINVCSSVCSVIMIAHDKTLKVTQSTSLMPPPPLPVGVQVEKGKGKGRGKAVAKGKVQGGGDDKDSDDELDDNDANDPSYEDSHDLSAQFIVQQAS
jgi:hypothetical protein